MTTSDEAAAEATRALLEEHKDYGSKWMADARAELKKELGHDISEASLATVAVTYLLTLQRIASERSRQLRKRIDALELNAQKSAFSYAGVFKEGEAYQRGDFATHDGSLWHCNAATTSRPGSGASWTLAVKRGKNGRN